MLGIFTAGFQVVSTSYFQSRRTAAQSVGAVHASSAASVNSLILILPLTFSLDGILYAGPIADVASAVIVSLFVVYELRKLNLRCAARQRRDGRAFTKETKNMSFKASMAGFLARLCKADRKMAENLQNHSETRGALDMERFYEEGAGENWDIRGFKVTVRELPPEGGIS